MAREETGRAKLEDTGMGLLTGLKSSGRQLLVHGRERREGIRAASVNIEKAAHDFRASLNIIIGFAELMLDEVTGKINAEQRRSLNDILNNARRLLDLVDDIFKTLENMTNSKK
jgi:signal transduction histidine kinase